MNQAAQNSEDPQKPEGKNNALIYTVYLSDTMTIPIQLIKQATQMDGKKRGISHLLIVTKIMTMRSQQPR